MRHQNLSYQEFLQGLHPIAIALRECTASVDRKDYTSLLHDEAKAGAQRGTRSLKVTFKLCDFDEMSFTADARLVVKVTSKGKKPLFEVEAAFDAHFHSSAPFTRKDADRFVQTELRLIAWPYFREFVAGVGARMAVIPVMIPLTLRQAPTPGTQKRVTKKRPD
jgi:hypothetical protein